MSHAAMGDAACIAIASITVPDSHARRRIDDEGLHSLAHSIEEVGLLQPIVLRPLGNGRYELLAGARRLRAVQALGRAGVPAVAVSSEGAMETSVTTATPTIRQPPRAGVLAAACHMTVAAASS